MKSTITKVILAAGIITLADHQKFTELKARSQMFTSHDRRYNASFADQAVAEASQAYAAAPSDENLDAFELALLHRDVRSGEKMMNARHVIEGLHREFIKSEFSPFALAILDKIAPVVQSHCAEFLEAEKARARDVIGSEAGASGMIAAADSVLQKIDRFRGRVRTSFNQPAGTGVTPDSFARELESVTGISFFAQDDSSTGAAAPVQAGEAVPWPLPANQRLGNGHYAWRLNSTGGLSPFRLSGNGPAVVPVSDEVLMPEMLGQSERDLTALRAVDATAAAA